MGYYTKDGSRIGKMTLTLDFDDNELNGLFDDELNEFKAKLDGAVQNALTMVGSTMKAKLKQHIEDDVYDKYTPRVYERRSKHPEDGPPLTDDSNIAVKSDSTSVTLEYLPTGYHDNLNWYHLDDNTLISRIENKSPAYRREPKDPPPIPNRPFWQKFTNEMTDGGEFAKTVLWALKAQGFEFEDNGEGVIRESEDGNYYTFWE